jgi:glycosyltransferase involved in cell wall biosynthesis
VELALGDVVMDTDDELPFVSVVVPTYNEEKNIARCLTSIRNQDYPEDKVEVIVVDGMSEDNTVAIAKNYQVRIVTNNKRIVGNAMKLGVEEAKGEIIAMIVADLELPQKDWLRRMLSPFSDPSVAGTLTFFGVKRSHPMINRCYHLMGGDPMISLAHASKSDNCLIMTLDNYFPTGAPLLRRQLVLEAGNFRSFLPRSEDVDMSYRLVKRGYKLVFVPNTFLYHYYVKSFSSYLRKTYKRMLTFVKYQHLCEFKYIPKGPNSKVEFLKSILGFVTITGLLSPVVKGIKRDHDSSWLCYPAIALSTLVLQCVVLTSTADGRRLLAGFIGGK